MDASPKEIERTLSVLFRPGDTVEMRVPGDRPINGYYRDFKKLAADAYRLNQELTPQQNVFCTLNPVDPQLFARRADVFGYARRGSGTKDSDVPIRRWMLVDVDPRRPAVQQPAASTQTPAAGLDLDAELQRRQIEYSKDDRYQSQSGETATKYVLSMYPRPAVFTEREFAAVLKRAERKGNTLSMYIRDAWDNEVLANATKNNPMRIEDHCVSICAHVTPAELKRLLSNSDIANGFCNRFLWFYTRRDERRAGALRFRAADFQQPIRRLQAAVESIGQRYANGSQQPISIPFSPPAAQLWRDALYPQLDIDSEEDTQLTLMCSRQAQQVCRIALIYAMGDGLAEIQPQHLQAACAIARYVWDSVDFVLSRPWWGDSGNVHDPAGMAPKVLTALRSQGPMMRKAISVTVLHRHRTGKEINALRDLLARSGQIRVEKQGTAEVWHPL